MSRGTTTADSEFDWLPDIDYAHFMLMAVRAMIASGDAPLPMLNDENAPEWEAVRDKAEQMWKAEK